MKIVGMNSVLCAALLTVLLGACSDTSPEQQILSAKEYLAKDDQKSAEIQVKNALQQNPDIAEARFLLGRILAQEAKLAAAEIEYRKALSLKYPESKVIPELARLQLSTGQFQKMVDEFGTKNFGDPVADATLQTLLAAALGALGKSEAAESAMTAALTADANFAPALMIRARQKAAQKDFESATLITDQIISREPLNADAWLLRGDLLQHTSRNPEEVLVAYKKSVEINPKFAAGHVAILTVYMEKNKLDDAEKQFSDLKKIAPNFPETSYIEAKIAYQKKDYKRAKEIAEKLLRISASNPRHLQLAGAVELQMNSLAQAEIYLTRADSAGPADPLTQRMLIVSYLRSGNADKALTILEKMKGKDGSALQPNMFVLAGEVYLQNNDPKAAVSYYDKALKYDPNNSTILTARAISQLTGGDESNATDDLIRISESDAGINADFALISTYLAKKQFDKALAAVDKLETKLPNKPISSNLRGRIKVLQGDPVAARKNFEAALAIDPTYFIAASSLAQLDLAAGLPEAAERHLVELLKKAPDNEQARLTLAKLAVARNADKKEVVASLSETVAKHPTSIAPRLLLIDYLLEKNDPKQAKSAAEAAVGAVPHSPELLSALGRVQQASGDFQQAIRTYSKVVTMQPLSPAPLVTLAEAQFADKNSTGAKQSLLKALELKPDFLEAQRRLIALATRENNFAEAVATAQTVQRQRPNSTIGFLLEADVSSARKDWEAAIATLRSGLQRGDSTDLAIRLHSVLRAAGKTSEADKLGTEWSRKHPKDSIFISYMANLDLNQRNYAAAEQKYLLALKITPNDPVMLNNIAWVTHQLGKGGALDYAEKAVKFAPNRPEFMDTLGIILAGKKDFTKASALLNQAILLQPTNNDFRLSLAKIYIQSGDKGKAKDELEKLSKLGDKYPAHAEVSTLMKSL